MATKRKADAVDNRTWAKPPSKEVSPPPSPLPRMNSVYSTLPGVNPKTLYKSIWKKLQKKCEDYAHLPEPRGPADRGGPMFDESFSINCLRIGKYLIHHEKFAGLAHEERMAWAEFKVWLHNFPETGNFPGNKSFSRDRAALKDFTLPEPVKAETQAKVLEARKKRDQRSGVLKFSLAAQDRDDREILTYQGPMYYAIHMEFKHGNPEDDAPITRRVREFFQEIEGGDDFNCRHKYSILCPKVNGLRDAFRKPYEQVAWVQNMMGIWFKDNLDHDASSTRDVRAWVGFPVPLQYYALDRYQDSMRARFLNGFKLLKFWAWMCSLKGEMEIPLATLREAYKFYNKGGAMFSAWGTALANTESAFLIHETNNANDKVQRLAMIEKAYAEDAWTRVARSWLDTEREKEAAKEMEGKEQKELKLKKQKKLELKQQKEKEKVWAEEDKAEAQRTPKTQLKQRKEQELAWADEDMADEDMADEDMADEDDEDAE